MLCSQLIRGINNLPNLSGTKIVVRGPGTKLQTYSEKNGDGHEAARKALLAASNSELTPIVKSVIVLKQQENDKLVKLFNVAYYIAKLLLLCTVIGPSVTFLTFELSGDENHTDVTDQSDDSLIMDDDD